MLSLLRTDGSFTDFIENCYFSSIRYSKFERWQLIERNNFCEHDKQIFCPWGFRVNHLIVDF